MGAAQVTAGALLLLLGLRCLRVAALALRGNVPRLVVGVVLAATGMFWFGEGVGIGWPLGVNMAVRASVFHTDGLWWDNRYDRVGNSLRGQGQREWCLRVRAAGLHGYYTPDMLVHHLVPADRLRKSYFRRWFYWYGVSRAVLYAQHGLDMESPDERTFDFSSVPHIAGVPRYMFRSAIQHVIEMIRHTVSFRPDQAFEHELWLCFFAGIVRQRWQDRSAPISVAVAAS